MLDSSEHLAAYRALIAAGGLSVPAATTIAGSVKTSTSGLVAAFSAMIDSGVDYPASIRDEIAFVSGVPAKLNGFIPACEALMEVITEAANTDNLLTLNIGWEVHCKANDLAPDSLMPAIQAITDTTSTAAAAELLAAIDPTATAAAMSEINGILSVGSGGGEEGGAPLPPPPIPSDLIGELKLAVDGIRNSVESAGKALPPIVTLHQYGRSGIVTSKEAFNSAIAISILANAGAGGAMKDAAMAIMPDSVKDALFPTR